MTDQEQNIAVAEWLGICTSKSYKQRGDWETAICDRCGKNPYDASHSVCNYGENLNAMREALLSMTEAQWLIFIGLVTGAEKDASRLFTRHDLAKVFKLNCTELRAFFLRTIGNRKD